MVRRIFEKVLNFISHLEKSLNSVKIREKYLISLTGLKTSLNFSTFLFLLLQESYPVSFIILQSVVTINYG